MSPWIEMGIKTARRIVVAVVGGTVVLLGIAMMVLPGPALVVIPLGLGILGLEFAWARRWLRHVREAAASAANRVRNGASANRAIQGPGGESDAPQGAAASDAERGADGARPR